MITVAFIGTGRQGLNADLVAHGLQRGAAICRVLQR